MNDTVAIMPKRGTLAAGALNRKRFAHMRDIEGKTPRQIARELDYLEWHVRKQLRRYDLERLSGSDQGSSVEAPQKAKGAR